jgi:hypothetical protein
MCLLVHYFANWSFRQLIILPVGVLGQNVDVFVVDVIKVDVLEVLQI